MKFYELTGLAILAIIMFLVPPSFGAQKKTKIDTTVHMEGNYQDNVFLSQDNPQGGYSLRAVPGINLHYITSRSRAELEYLGRVEYFSYDTGEEGTFSDERFDIYHEGRISLGTRLRPSGQKGIEFKLDERYIDNKLVSDIHDYSANRQSKYFSNTLQPRIGWDVSKKIKLLGSYENEIVQFNSGYANNSIQHSYSLMMEYYKSRRNFFSFGYRNIKKYFQKTTDYAVQEGEFAYRRIVNRTWSGGLELSYQVRDYVQEDNVEDWSGTVTTIFLRAVRRKKSQLELSYQNRRNSFDSSVSYGIDRIDLKGRWQPTGKLSVNLSPFYQRDSYDFPAGRKDSLWGFSWQIAFHPRKDISLGVGYDHAVRDSSENGFGYENNTYHMFFSLNQPE